MDFKRGLRWLMDYMNPGSKGFIDYLDQSLLSLVFDVLWLFL